MNWLKKVDYGIWITIISWIAGGFIWASNQTYKTDANSKDITRNRTECIEKYDSLKEDLKEIKQDIKLLLGK